MEGTERVRGCIGRGPVVVCGVNPLPASGYRNGMGTRARSEISDAHTSETRICRSVLTRYGRWPGQPGWAVEAAAVAR